MFKAKESKSSTSTLSRTSGAATSESGAVGRTISAAPAASASEMPASATEFTKANRKAVPSILSPDLEIVGNLTSEGELQVDGKIEGDIKCRLLTIGPSAKVSGTLEAETVRVSGAVSGRIEAKSVTLERNARVEAELVHESLTMESGAHFEGEVKRRGDTAKSKSESPLAAVQPGRDGAPADKHPSGDEPLKA